ncbi:MAG: hypothetical protein LBD96_10970 [Treponema sp.]|nr:hypothetical protein [Treponema sp.]
MPGKGKTPYYFPSRDADVISWVRNFITVLAANAARWGIAEALVTALGALAMAFEEAYNRRMLPDAGKVSVAQKDLALKALKKGVQDMVNGHINHNPAVTPDDRVALGLYIYSATRNEIPVPGTTVIVRAVPGQVRQIIAYCTDSGTPERRGKPYGAKSIELACAVLPSPPSGIEDLVRFVTASKSPVVLTFREEDRGKTVYLAGRWRGHQEQEGVWGSVVPVIVP